MNTTRQAILLVSRQVLEAIMPDWRWHWRRDPVYNYTPPAAPFYVALKLPENCRITGVSADCAFNKDQIAFRIESPDFVETMEGCTLPEVRAVYQHKHHFTVEPDVWLNEQDFPPGQLVANSSTGYFLRWDGPAVAVQRTYGPDGKELPNWTTEAAAIHENPNRVPDPDGLPLGPLENDTDRSRDFVAMAETVNEVTAAIKEYASCWRCNGPTARRLPDGTAECEECAKKGLL